MINVSAARLVALMAADEENNPFITQGGRTGTYSTDRGTEVLSASYLGTKSTWDMWTATPNVSNVAAAVVDLGTPRALDFAAIAAHNISDLGGTVELQYSSDGSSWTDCGAGTATPDDNEAVAWRFEAVTAQYWRIRITNITDDVSVGTWLTGSELIIPQRIYQGYTPPIVPTNIEMRSTVSEGGNLISSVAVNRGSSISAEFTHIDDSFVRLGAFQNFMRRYNSGEPVFFGWRPDKYGDLFYVQRGSASAIVPTNSGPAALMSFTLAGRAYHE